jgi:TP901 family phage tail tape measure protein
MPDFVVVTAFKAKDQTNETIRRLTKNTKIFGNTADKAFRNATKRASVFGGVVKGVLAANVIAKGMALASQGVRSVTEEFIAFDQAVTSASAKFPEKIQRGTKEFEELAAAARKVGAETQFTAAQAAEGLDFLAMAGFNAKQAMAALPGVVDLATAADMDLARASDIASDALGAFNLMTKDSAQLTENLTRINDVFAKTVTTSNTTMETLFETMKEAGPVVKGAGASVETFAALTGVLGSASIKGSKAGTTLKNMFLRLSKPPREAAKALAKLKIETVDSSGNLRDMVDVLEEIRIKTKKMGTAQRSAALDAIFSKRAVAGANILVSAGAEKLNEYRQQLEKSAGASRDMAAEMRKSLQNRLASLKSSVIEVGFRFIDAFKDKIPGAIDRAISAVRGFDVNNVIEGVKKVVSFFGKLISIIKALSPLIWGMVAAWAAYKAMMAAVMAAEAIKFFFKMAKAIRAAAVAQGLLNAAMIANPIGAVAVAIGLLVAATILLVKNWDIVVGVWEEGVKIMENAISGVVETIKDMIFWVAEAGLKVAEFFGAAEKGTAKKFAMRVEEERRILAEPITRVITDIPKPGERKTAAETGKPLEEIRKSPAETRKPPNAGRARTEESERKIGFEGKMTFVNPPPGAELEMQTTGAPPIRTEMLGVNP